MQEQSIFSFGWISGILKTNAYPLQRAKPLVNLPGSHNRDVRTPQSDCDYFAEEYQQSPTFFSNLLDSKDRKDLLPNIPEIEEFVGIAPPRKEELPDLETLLAGLYGSVHIACTVPKTSSEISIGE